MAQILDQYGRPINTGRLRDEIAGASATRMRSIYGTHVVRGLTPQRLASVLRQAETGDAASYLDLAEDMEERDLHYLGVLGTRRRQVSQLTVTVEPADSSAEAEADADLVREWIQQQGELEDELFNLLDAISKGFAVCEIMWEMSERQWMPKRLEYRLPRWFRFDSETGQKLLLRDGTSDGVELEPAKFVQHRAAAKSGLPIRGGLARCACWAWLFKNYTLRDWVRFVEAYGMPVRVGKYHEGATQAQKDVLLDAVTAIASDAACIIPQSMLIDFISRDSATDSGTYEKLLEYVDASISKAVLGQTLTTQEGKSGTGSFALGKVHDEVRGDIERSDARQLAATLNRDLVRPLVLLNHGPRRAFPRILIGRDEESDPVVVADVVSKLVPVGVRFDAAEVRHKLGFTDPEDAAEVLAPPKNDTRVAFADATLRRALARIEPNVRDAIDDAVEARLEDGWEPMMDPVIAPIRAALEAAVERGETLEDFRRRLEGLAAEMDADAVIELLHRMGFTAAISGDAGLVE